MRQDRVEARRPSAALTNQHRRADDHPVTGAQLSCGHDYALCHSAAPGRNSTLCAVGGLICWENHAKRWFDAVGHYSREEVLGGAAASVVKPTATADGDGVRTEDTNEDS